MSELNLDRVKQIFLELRGETEPERERLIDELCGEDETLRARVRDMLASEEDAGDFLHSPTMPEANAAALAAASSAATAPPERAGSRIGQYKLLQEIGEGGFGVVYMAEQEEPIRRRVALKVIKPGMDTKQVIARFEAERQALAMMDHPNIAKVFEAGTTPAGRPYFVMELVRGIPITDYCDEHRLGTRERLALFSEVCGAVHHAHQAGIIHRDIKPSNVMITLHDGTPVPKVIDFGVAKATHQRLTDTTLFTEFNQFIGTPTYMSPEQAAYEGLDVDNRADVYSLGVLLYELLTGTTPHDGRAMRRAAYVEVIRILKEEEPPKPSTRIQTMGKGSETHAMHRDADPGALAKVLRGDLDWIVMKALEKERSRRYESASEMASDIARYFDQMPIVARPPSAVYRARKLLRRKRGPFAAAAVIVLAMLADVGYVGWQRSQALSPPEELAEVAAAISRDEQRALPEPGFTSSIAPDGRRGAFSVIDWEGMNVGVIDYETGEMTRITDLEWTKNNGVAWSGIWAPDSRRLAYSQVTPDGITEIRVAVPGETPRVIFRNERVREPGSITVMVSDWLQDGSALVVSARHDDESNTLGLVSLRDGSFTHLLTVPWPESFLHAPKASPDGRFLLIEEDGDVFLLGTDGSGKVRLTDHPAADGGWGTMWSRDGKHVLFASDRSGTKGLWALPVEDGRRAGPPFLVRAGWDGGFLGWVGDELAYTTNLNIQNIYTLPVDPETGQSTGEAKLIPYSETGGFLQFPRWSPDGREIAFLADARVVIQALEGGAAREFRAPAGVRPMTALRWLPDGTGISFVARNRQNRPTLLRLALAEGDWETTPLPENTQSGRLAFEWSPTGDSFYYSQVSDDLPARFLLIEHHVATGAEDVLHTLDSPILRLELSPDGVELAFGRARDMSVLSRETGSVRSQAWERDGASRSWSVDGWHLAVDCGDYESSEAQTGICVVDVGTGNETKIELDPAEVLSRTMGTVLEFYTMRDFYLSPAGDRIVFNIHAVRRQVMIMADPLDGQSSSGQRR